MRLRAQVRGAYTADTLRRKPNDPAGRPRTLPVAERGESGFVYFVQAGEQGPIKVGWSMSPQERIDTLQTSSPFELRVLGIIEGSKDDEAAFHRMFAEYRLKGEWFKDCSPIRDALNHHVVSSRRPVTHRGECCSNCRARLVVDEDLLCKACIEFMDCWATPEFIKLWRAVPHAA